MNWYKKSQQKETVQAIAFRVRSLLSSANSDDLRAMCLDASKTLKQELIKSGYRAVVVQGTFAIDISDPEMYSDWEEDDFEDEEQMNEAQYSPLHYWVELNDNTIIDITADQFNDEIESEVDYMQPITIGTYSQFPRYKALRKN